MTKRMEGYARLDMLLDEHGEQWVIDMMSSHAIDGMPLRDIAREMLGIPYYVLWSWLNDEPHRLREYEVAVRGSAETMAHETVQIADAADDPKLRIDSRKWLSAKRDSRRFGEHTKVEVSGSVSLISLLSSLKEVEVEAIEAEVVEVLPAPKEPEQVTVIPSQEKSLHPEYTL